eukprot:GILK01004794.1.p1 GENE.GILK01004794.1~~GILK01004794.1.p1  ORF type:complete len:1385 (-),score=418.54 GILK01004794.1:245-4204(-)
MENFKSYAGIKTVGPFHKSFTSIVGPNGSGKSNVIDAMLFVFGKRANKIRQNKVGDLIHQSVDYRDLQYARVSVYFHDIIDEGDGEDEYQVVQNSQFVVTREALKNNQSKYYINGKSSTFTEVTEMLNKRGIDLIHNRFLILQGEVEHIAMMKPRAQNPHEEGLLEYLEDLIGSNKYVDLIEEKGKEVEALTEQRQERLNRVKVVEKERESLQTPKTEAEEYIKKEVKLMGHRGALYQIFAGEALSHVDGVAAKKAELEAKRQHELDKIKDQEAKLAEREALFTEASAAHDAISAELKTRKDEFVAFERQDIQFKEDLKHLKQQEKKLQETKKSEEKKHKEQQTLASKIESEIPSVEKSVAEAQQKKEKEEVKLEAIYNDLKGETEGLRIEKEAKEKELEPLVRELNASKAITDVAKAELKLLEDKASSGQKDFESAQQKVQEYESTIEERQREIKQRNVDLKKDQQTLTAAQSKLTQVTEEEVVAQQRVSQLRTRLEQAKSAQQQSENKSVVLRALMEAKAKGKLRGVHGRLGDLGKIDKKYDVAISTACGALNFIVVDTTDDGQRCVEYLRKHNIGRATFVMLEQVQNLLEVSQRPLETPENALRLFDLVQPKHEMFLPAFYHALRDTLVADDLDMATRIAYDRTRRWRVVTLDGQLVDISGTMSGGGAQKASGGMSAVITETVSESELTQMTSELEEATQLLQELRSQKAKLQAQIDSLEKQIKSHSMAVSKASMDVEALSKNRKDLSERLDSIQRNAQLSEAEEARIAELQKQIAGNDKSLTKVQKKVTLLESEVQRLHNAIMEAGGEKLKKQKAKVDEWNQKMDDATRTVTKMQVDIKTANKAAEKAQKAAVKAESDLGSVREELVKKKADFEQLEVEALKVMEAFEATKQLLERKSEELNQIKSEYEDMKKQFAKVRTVEVDIANQLEDYEKSIKESASKLQHWIKKLHDLRQQYIDLPEEYTLIGAVPAFRKMPPKRTIPALTNITTTESKEKRGGKKGAASKRGGKRSKRKQAESEEEEQEEQQSVEPTAAVPAAAAEGEEGDGASKMAEESTEGEVEEAQVLPEGCFDPLKDFSLEELTAMNKDELQYEITMLEEALSSMKPNMNAILEYTKKHNEYVQKVADLDAITEQRDAARKGYDGLRKQRLDEFMAGFSIISMKLKEMYQMITLGGDAELELVDSLDPFSEGILFSVRPPKKSWKQISNLSGGEKTLSSLALVFALHHYKPTPLYVMDEIDAALDFKNVSIVANYIKERTKNAQFVIISLRNNMFEVADRLVGIYKTNDVTKSVTINPSKFVIPKAPLSDATNQL